MTFVLGSLQLRAALEMQGLQGWKLAAWQHGPQRAEALFPVLEPRPLLPRSQPGAGRRGQDGRACAAAVGRSPLRSCCAPCVAAGSSVLGVEGRRGGGGRSREGADGTGGGLGRRASGTLWTGVGTGWPRVAGARRRQACTGCGCAGGVPGEGRGFGRLPWLEAGSRPLRCHKGVRLWWLEPKEGGWALRTWWAEGQGPRKWSALSPWGMGASESQEMGPGCAV